ncbi:uncharacterized protein Z520_10254 [Fonsecaea multimorphosa CBS 102226]|uniref:Amino acid permease/ SLC12A domain-containing protein n=1 Tax=Fonsecaea multimorphosa CBS 102226 TaxID=1442371 RepID=A0A0D2JL04_9EURO|nr:uncharacterized protein Z520_10254 [Fonsecaea multimorphosa CBS 102226]KIX93917.1 hypothetical protein Z520_10254 [Fonsecaea multimorphosa CBS 102226]OAL19269.1 hypothetical protein AYO22_09813 [Fonsecaea multimorphosa]
MESKDPEVAIATDGPISRAPTDVQGEISHSGVAEPALARTLESRHLIFFSLGSSIGLGLWLGSGATLATGGPVSNVLGFLTAGVISWSVAQATGEIACNYPIPSAFPRWADKFIDRAPAFTLAWSYWLLLTLTLAAEIQGAVTVVRYWTDALHVSVWVTIFLAILLLINVFEVKLFGEVEFFFSVIKFFWIFVVIIMFIVISAGGAPNHTTTGFRYWREIPFINGFKGFLTGLYNCIFSMAGTEFLGLTAAEARDPKRSVPKAVNTVWIRLGLFYVGGAFFTTLCVDPRDPDLFGASGTNASPFNIAMLRAGLPNAAHVMNGIILISVLSCGNAGAYASSRIPVGLAHIGMAPKIFLKTDARGRPWPSIMLTFVVGGGISYLNASASASQVFVWLARLVGLGELFNWAMIFLTHIRFRQAWAAQGYTKADLPWATKFYPYSSGIGLGMCLLLIVNQFYLSVWPLGESPSADNFFGGFISIVVLLFVYICAKIYWRGPLYRKRGQIDLVRDRRIYPPEDSETKDGRTGFPLVKALWMSLRKRPGDSNR